MYRNFIKPFLDFVIALGLLLLVWPLIILTIIITYLDTGLPIYNRLRKREGKNKKTFTMYKIRTKVYPCEANGYKESYTKVSKLIDRLRLNELPQLINVLKGDLSLIGPRPVIGEEVERYKENKDKLLSIRPGITGYWSAFCKEDTSYEERMNMELYYVDNMSFGLDLKIVFGTAWIILKRIANKRKV